MQIVLLVAIFPRSYNLSESQQIRYLFPAIKKSSFSSSLPALEIKFQQRCIQMAPQI